MQPSIEKRKQQPNFISLRDSEFQYKESLAHKIKIQCDWSQIVKHLTFPPMAFKIISQTSDDYENNCQMSIIFMIGPLQLII